MTLIIDELTFPDRRLTCEIIEMLRETAPELLALPRPLAGTRRRRKAALAAALFATAIALLALGHRPAHAADVPSRSSAVAVAGSGSSLFDEEMQEIAARCVAVRRDAANGKSSPDLQRWIRACNATSQFGGRPAAGAVGRE